MNMDEQNWVALALASGFSLAAHAGQKRKFTGEDYYNHPKRVCEILEAHGYSDLVVLIAALLHDVAEDTHVTLRQIETYFGKEVAELVEWLTKLKHPHPMSRADRKRIEADRLKQAPVIVKTMKLADRLDNCPDIIANDPSFAPVFVAETRHLLDHALKEGDAVLWAKVDKIVREFQEQTA